MAKPSGAVSIGEYFLELENSELNNGTMYMYFILRLPRMPKEWNDDTLDNKFCKLQYSAELVNESSSSTYAINFEWKAGNVPATTEIEYYNESTLDWMSWTTDTEYPGCIYFWPDDVNALGYCLVELAITTGAVDGTNDRQVTFINLSTANDDSEPSGEAEKIERATAANRLYVPDKPLSAWHMRNILGETLLHMLYHNSPSFSVPIAGEPVGFIV